MSPLTPCGLPWYIHWSTPLSSVTTIGRLVLVLGRHVAEEHVGRFHDVVVDAHQDQVVGLHTQVVPSSRCDRLCAFGQRFSRIGQDRPAGDRAAPRRAGAGRQLPLRGRRADHRLALARGAPDRVRDRRCRRGGDGVGALSAASAAGGLDSRRPGAPGDDEPGRQDRRGDVRPCAHPRGRRPCPHPRRLAADPGDDDLRASLADRSRRVATRFPTVSSARWPTGVRGPGPRGAAEPADLREPDRGGRDGLHEGASRLGDGQ